MDVGLPEPRRLNFTKCIILNLPKPAAGPMSTAIALGKCRTRKSYYYLALQVSTT